ncbi:MAG: Nudix family hydrolase [Candidatus Kinetoplastibacterium crithidii]|nr:MAG: Nudix family hydrolase [Candidatus Kinetoplastibacterium crithidii]
MANNITIKVSIGIILNEHNEILLEQRPKNESYPFYWGFPGGKVEKNESPNETLNRELKEELDIDIIKSYPWVNHIFYKQNIKYHLLFYRVIQWQGNIYGKEKQNLQWTNINQINKIDNLLPSASYPIKWLKIPNTYGITSIQNEKNIESFLIRLDAALSKGLSLVQFREPNWPDGLSSKSLYKAMNLVLSICKKYNARLLINSSHPESWWKEANGVHLRSIDMENFSYESNKIKSNFLTAVSTHNSNDLEFAFSKLNADFAVLGPVNNTLTHPGELGIGWSNFKRLVKEAKLPVFSLGGQSENCRELAYQHGAHGIAGIRAFI